MNYIIVNKEHWLKPLQAICSIVEKKASLAILSNVFLQINQNGNEKHIELIGSDLEVQLNYHLYIYDETSWQVHSESESKLGIQSPSALSFNTTIDAHKFASRINVLNNGPIKLKFQNEQVEILQQTTKLTSKTLSAEDYPRMQVGEFKHQFEISQKQLKHQLSSVAFAMALQDVRYYLNGCLLHFENQKMYWVATDGHRMACSIAPIPKFENQSNTNGDSPFDLNKQSILQIIISRKTIVELLRLLDDSDQMIKISFNDQAICFEHTHFSLSSKLIDGKFPDFKRLMLEHPYSLKIERLELLAALQRANIISQDKLRSAKWILKTSGLNVYAINQDQDEIDEHIPSIFDGEAMETGFNITYWLDVLKSLKMPQLTVMMNNANTSAILKVEDEIHQYIHILMPMRV